jgi:hypothetical protein
VKAEVVVKRWIRLAVVLLPVLALVAGGVYLHRWRRQYDPLYHGRPLSAWSRQAVRDERPEARREAVQVLLEALRRDRAERGNVYVFIGGFDLPEGAPLPPEVLPFLEEASQDEDKMMRGYTIAKLHLVGSAAAPALERVLEEEKDETIRGIAAEGLRKLRTGEKW